MRGSPGLGVAGLGPGCGVLGGGGNREYWQKAISLIGKDNILAYWRNVSDGRDVINGYNATLTNMASGVGVDAIPSGYFSGSTKFLQSSSGLYTLFNNNSSEWFYSAHAKITDWSTVNQTIFKIRDASGNTIIAYLSAANTVLLSITTPSGGTANYYIRTNRSNWFHYGFSQSVSNSRIRFWFNGGFLEKSYSYAPAMVRIGLGFEPYNNNNYLTGYQAHAILGKGEIEISKMRKLATVNRSPFILSFIGDSISNQNLKNWDYSLSELYPYAGICNHANGGATIMPNSGNDMDTQVASASNDNANRIYVLLGTNDSTASGDQAGILAEYVENINELKSTNPNAEIICINLIKRWTDAGGSTEYDLSNTRATIISATASAGVRCLNPYADGNAGLSISDYSDGTHLTESGGLKLAQWVYAQG